MVMKYNRISFALSFIVFFPFGYSSGEKGTFATIN